MNWKRLKLREIRNPDQDNRIKIVKRLSALWWMVFFCGEVSLLSAIEAGDLLDSGKTQDFEIG